jgi:hypothetical protein
VKLPAHRAGLPGKVISFYIVPLDPAYKAGLAGHVPVKIPAYRQAGKCQINVKWLNIKKFLVIWISFEL